MPTEQQAAAINPQGLKPRCLGNLQAFTRSPSMCLLLLPLQLSVRAQVLGIAHTFLKQVLSSISRRLPPPLQVCSMPQVQLILLARASLIHGQMHSCPYVLKLSPVMMTHGVSITRHSNHAILTTCPQVHRILSLMTFYTTCHRMHSHLYQMDKACSKITFRIQYVKP